MYASQVCFESWLRRRGSPTFDSAETTIRQVRRFLETHGALTTELGTDASHSGGFFAVSSHSDGIRTKKKDRHPNYLVVPEVFRRDVCAGFDPKMVLRNLRAQGYLDHDRGRFDKSVRLPGVGKRKVYAIKARILEQRQTIPAVHVERIGDNGDNGDKGEQRLEPATGTIT